MYKQGAEFDPFFFPPPHTFFFSSTHRSFFFPPPHTLVLNDVLPMLKAQVNPGGALFQGGASILKGPAAAAYAAPGAGSPDMQPVERVLRMLYDAGTQFTCCTSTPKVQKY